MAAYEFMDPAEVSLVIEEVCEKINEAHELLLSLGITEEPYFHAYVSCHLEGERRGWLGGPFLIDEIRKFHHDPEECP